MEEKTSLPACFVWVDMSQKLFSVESNHTDSLVKTDQEDSAT